MIAKIIRVMTSCFIAAIIVFNTGNITEFIKIAGVKAGNTFASHEIKIPSLSDAEKQEFLNTFNSFNCKVGIAKPDLKKPSPEDLTEFIKELDEGVSKDAIEDFAKLGNLFKESLGVGEEFAELKNIEKK